MCSCRWVYDIEELSKLEQDVIRMSIDLSFSIVLASVVVVSIDVDV